jgi:carboxymethylenebutenolidase
MTYPDTLSKEFIELKVPGSSPMRAYVSRPSTAGPHPGLMVFQEAYGVNGHIRDVADRFAAQGYVAIAPELFHRTAPPGFEGDYTNFASVSPHFQAVTNENAEADVKVTFEWLQSNSRVSSDRISCVGFCMGGRISFLANTVVPVRAAVSYYGGRIAQTLLDRTSRLHAPILLYWGGLDKHIPVTDRDAVTASLDAIRKPYVNVVFSTADHAFFCDQRPAYNPDSAKQSWALTLEFLRA